MTDIDMSTGSLTDYLIALVVFWTLFVSAFFIVVLYVWPTMERIYWKMAVTLHHTIRQFITTTRGHNRSYYTGYKGGSK